MKTITSTMADRAILLERGAIAFEGKASTFAEDISRRNAEILRSPA